MYMDDIKLFAQKEKELETRIQAVIIYSQDIGMEFGIEKFAMLIMKSRNQQKTERIELPTKYQNARKKGNLQILGNIGSGHHQISGNEEKNKIKKNIFGERENNTKPNYIIEISSKK